MRFNLLDFTGERSAFGTGLPAPWASLIDVSRIECFMLRVQAVVTSESFFWGKSGNQAKGTPLSNDRVWSCVRLAVESFAIIHLVPQQYPVAFFLLRPLLKPNSRRKFTLLY